MRFGRLKGVREAIGRESEGTPKRIFAEDIPDEWAAHKGSKEYLVSTLRDIHRHCFYRERPNVYEIINHEAHNYLYFDMDREKRMLLPPASPGLVPDEFYSVNASDITRDDVYQSIKFLQSVSSAYIGLALGLSSPELKIMSGSSKHKLSLHIVVPDVLMDSCQTSTAAFAWEFAAFMEKQVRVMLSSGDTPADTRRALLRIVNVCPTAPIGGSFVDHSVYTRSQCFRLLGCCKPGKAPLTLVTLGAPIDDLYFYEERNWEFGNVAGTVRSFASTLVTPANLDALQEVYTVRLGSTFSFRSAFRVEVERNWRRQDDMAAEARVEGVPEEEDWLERSRGLGGEGVGTGTGISSMMTTKIWCGPDSAYDVTDDRTEVPIVVFCSLASHATMILSYWIECVAPTERAKTRARGIWGSIQKHAFAQDFLSYPNRFARECDILFVTPILQAGHSLDKWFRLSFSLLTNGNLTHRDEFQFTARLRQREDLIPYRYAYIESGLGDGHLADERQITTDLDHTARVYGDPDEGEDIVISTLAEAHAELADTKNRHTLLWLERFRSNPSDIVTFLRLYDDDDLVKAPIQECLELKAQLELHQEQAENYVSSQAVFLVAPRASRHTESTSAARREPSRSPVPTRVSTPGPTWDETPGPTQEAPPAPTLEGTPVPTSDLGVGGSHVLSEELGFEAQSLVSYLDTLIVPHAGPGCAYLPTFLFSIPEPQRNNRKAQFYIREVVLLGVYHDLLLAKAGVPSLWNERCVKAKGDPKKSSANQFAEMLFDLQELMYQRKMRADGVVNPSRFLGWFEGEWPEESVKDVDDPAFFDICNRRAEAWSGLAQGRTFAKVVREGQRSPRQHLAAVFKKFGLGSSKQRSQTRLASGERSSEYVHVFRVTDVEPVMQSLYPMRQWPEWRQFQEYLSGPMFSYLAQAKSGYDAAELVHQRTNPEWWARPIRDDWILPSFPQ
ncbi:hypothetical protein K3495_g12552 [Podosphaera aphanis]|nr:hypothetical protein K3495_g12552 [Podosphaera aphanis]